MKDQIINFFHELQGDQQEIFFEALGEIRQSACSNENYDLINSILERLELSYCDE